MSATFREIQAAYARHSISTYPVALDQRKKPKITGYTTIGLVASKQLLLKFGDEPAAGFCAGAWNRVSVIDIDSDDDRLFAEVEKRFGRSPLVGRTPSGGRHCYFRHDGEPRKIRPFPDVDVLGAGNVVCIGSVGPKGRYEVERGDLDDLDRLPRIRPQTPAVAPVEPASVAPDLRIPEGTRDDNLWRHCMRCAPHVADLDALIEEARRFNTAHMAPPLSDAQAVAKARSAWRYECAGLNFLGGKGNGVLMRFDEIDLAIANPDAAALLLFLRRAHLGQRDTFVISPSALNGGELRWSPYRIRAARQYLLDHERIVQLHHGGKHRGDASEYGFAVKGQNFDRNTNNTPPPAAPPGDEEDVGRATRSRPRSRSRRP